MVITDEGRAVVASVGARTAVGYARIEERFGSERLATLHTLLADLALVEPERGVDTGELAS